MQELRSLRAEFADTKSQLQAQIVEGQRKEQALCTSLSQIEQEKKQLMEQGGSATELVGTLQEQLRTTSLQAAELTGFSAVINKTSAIDQCFTFMSIHCSGSLKATQLALQEEKAAKAAVLLELQV